MRAIALALKWGRGEAVVKASQACAGAARCPEVESPATRLLWWRTCEPIGGLRCRFGLEVPA